MYVGGSRKQVACGGNLRWACGWLGVEALLAYKDVLGRWHYCDGGCYDITEALLLSIGVLKACIMEQCEYVACCGSLKRYAACRTMQSISLNPGTRASFYAGCAQVLYIKLLDTALSSRHLLFAGNITFQPNCVILPENISNTTFKLHGELICCAQ